MAGAAITSRSGARPALATTYEGDDPDLLARIAPLVDFIEISPDTIAASNAGQVHLRKSVLDEYAAVRGQVDLIAHGIGLSIGSFDRWNESYIHLLDELFGRFDIAWHSEHLGYTTVDGHYLGTMLTMPRTDEALDLLSARVEQVTARYGLPFLVENVAGLLPDPPGPWSAAGFLNELVSRTGCGLLLDAYNLECDRANIGLDVGAFLAELAIDAVAEIHVAGGIRQGRFQLDVHSQRLAPSTRTLADTLSARVPAAPVTFEVLPQAVRTLGPDAVVDELRRLAGDTVEA
jgi:uncharacterized protein (UPF0276 family)